MRISTKGTYALEIIVDLAMHSSEEHLERLKNIAARRGLSEKVFREDCQSNEE